MKLTAFVSIVIAISTILQTTYGIVGTVDMIYTEVMKSEINRAIKC